MKRVSFLILAFGLGAALLAAQANAWYTPRYFLTELGEALTDSSLGAKRAIEQ